MTKEVNCMNCMVGKFKDDLCDEKMCKALKRIGKSDDVADILMLAKEIVRCKDCKHQNECEEVVLFEVTDNEVMGHRVHWCSYGERR